MELRLKASDPDFEAVNNLMQLYNAMLNPGVHFYASKESKEVGLATWLNWTDQAYEWLVSEMDNIILAQEQEQLSLFVAFINEV